MRPPTVNWKWRPASISPEESHRLEGGRDRQTIAVPDLHGLTAESRLRDCGSAETSHHPAGDEGEGINRFNCQVVVLIGGGRSNSFMAAAGRTSAVSRSSTSAESRDRSVVIHL